MSTTISQNDAYAWKAKAISRGKLLERFRDLIQNMADNVSNEGDRVYFGSTNDYDELREIGQEMDMWKWDAIMRERPEPDPYADCRQLRSALTAKDAEIARLREALDECEDYFDNRADADCDQNGYIPNEEMKLLHAVRTALLGGSNA